MNIPGQIDVIKELARPTEKKVDFNFAEEIKVEAEKPKVNPSDFDYTKINEIGLNKDPIIIETEKPAEPVKPVKTFEQFKEEAINLTIMLTSLADMGLVKWYRKKLITKDEYILAKRLMRKVKANSINKEDFTPDENELYFTLLEINDFEEEQKTTDAQIELIAQPAAELMQKWNKSTSPEMRLGGAILSVYLTKLMVVIGS